MSRRSTLQTLVRLQPGMVATVVGVCALIVGATYIRSYFFLYDDFAVLGEASIRPPGDLLQQPRFDFYRPAVFLLAQAQFVAFGWSHPGAYIAGALALHAVCAGLVYVLVRRLQQDRSTSLLAAAFFLMSPWATEPYLWFSGLFDRLATAGALASLALGIAVLEAPNRTRALMAGFLGCLAASIALLAKEIGVIIPALFAATIVLACGPRKAVRTRPILYGASLLMVTIVYLTVREGLLPGLGGGYGDLRTLFQKAAIARNVFSHLRALVVLPFPQPAAVSELSFQWVASRAFELSLAIALWYALRAHWKLGLLCAMGIAAAIVPVSWVGLIAGSSAGNRFLYLPGVWFALLLALGIRQLQRRAVRPLAATLSCACVVLITGYCLTSVVYQVNIWKRACALSRAAIEQIAPYASSPRKLFIPNLPSLFVDGPYMVSDAAFTYYFRRPTGSVRLRQMALKYDRGDVWFSFWLEAAPPPPPAADEQVVLLDLPVKTRLPNLVGLLEAPARGAALDQPFTIRGWAVDTASPAGSGVDAVHVYAYPEPGSDASAIFLGAAQYGGERPDVGQAFGRQFSHSEFRLNVSTLRPGRYRLVVFPHAVLSGDFPSTLSTTITVR